MLRAAWVLALVCGGAAAHAVSPKAKLVDINSASVAELKTLPGIGDAEAARIVAARPYRSKAFLVEAKVLSEAQFDAVNARIVAVQKNLPPAAKAKP